MRWIPCELARLVNAGQLVNQENWIVEEQLLCIKGCFYTLRVKVQHLNQCLHGAKLQQRVVNGQTV